MSSHSKSADPAQPANTPAVPRHAASVLLLREHGDSIEVLLTRRHKNMAFMGGMWVFPGGTLCPADTSPAALALLSEPARLQCHRLLDLEGQPLPVTTCQGLAIAAVRETLEETGVLLATTVDGRHCGSESLARVNERRQTIVSQPDLFATSLREQHLRLDLRGLVYWAHWITPSVVPKRFDTRFFLAVLPPGQVASIDAVEATEMTWMTPAALIAATHDGSMKLSRPTLYNLMELDASVRRYLSLDAILTGETQRDIAPVLPKVITTQIEGAPRMIVMPWDVEYHSFDGLGVSRQTSYPASLRELPARARER